MKKLLVALCLVFATGCVSVYTDEYCSPTSPDYSHTERDCWTEYYDVEYCDRYHCWIERESEYYCDEVHLCFYQDI